MMGGRLALPAEGRRLSHLVRVIVSLRQTSRVFRVWSGDPLSSPDVDESDDKDDGEMTRRRLTPEQDVQRR